MTPKEKANELCNTYYTYITSKLLAENCALTCVNEVIKQWEYIDVYLADMGGELNPNLKYWYEVKKEIKKVKL